MKNNQEPKIQVELSLKQANIIQEALDLYSRLGMAQFDNLRGVPIAGNGNPNYYELEEVFNQLHKLYCPELPLNGYYGIFHEKTPEQSKIAWDIQQVMRYIISWHLHPEGGVTVNFNEPFQSAKENLCKCKIIDIDNKIQNMDCSGCKQPALNCEKCIRKIMEYFDVKDFYTTEKQIGVLYEDGIYEG